MQYAKYAFILLAIALLGACGKTVPPGTTVLILTAAGKSTIKTEGAYKAWGRDKLYFVDTKLKSFPKNIQVLCADDINMSVSLKWLGSFEVTPNTIDVIKTKVQATEVKRGDITGFELSLQQFFNTAVVDVLSSTARDVISPYVTDNIREQRGKITAEIKQRFLKRMQDLKYPLHTADVMVTNLDYPPEVTEKRKAIKAAELQDLENAAIAKAQVAAARRAAELATEQGKAKLVEAQADAAANKARSATLTPEILAVKQLETLVRLAEGQNNTVVVIPFEAIRPGLSETLLNREATERVRDALTRR